MKTITLVNEKGGVGKTTLAVHLAAGLAVRGARVMLIDADAQGHSTAHLGQTEAPGLYNLVVRNADWSDVNVLVDPIHYAHKGQSKGQLFLMASNIETRLIPMATDDQFALVDRLEQVEGSVDYVIVDTSPTPSLLHAMIYVASNYILIPSQPEAFSLDGMKKTISRIPTINKQKANMGLGACSLLGIQMTMADMNTNAHNYALKQTNKYYGGHVWKPIDKRTKYREAQIMSQTLFAFAPQSTATDDMWQFVDRVQTKVS